jgi:hypothetical protein
MFSQVYFHPVRRAFDYHAGKALKEVLRSTEDTDGSFPEPTSEDNLKKYLDPVPRKHIVNVCRFIVKHFSACETPHIPGFENVRRLYFVRFLPLGPMGRPGCAPVTGGLGADNPAPAAPAYPP